MSQPGSEPARRVAVVTGGAAGIGAAIAGALSAAGYRVASADLSHGDFGVDEMGSTATGWCDVSDRGSVFRFIEDAARHLGPIDTLVHNAGIYPMTPFLEVGEDEWRRVMATNLDSAFHLCQAVLPGMASHGWGRIVLVSSNTVHMGLPRLAPYIASKAGLIGLARALAGEFGRDGVTVNVIAPNLTRTPGTRRLEDAEPEVVSAVIASQAVGRMGQPEDLTGAVLWLASEQARFMTGQTMIVDGGTIKR